MGQTWTEPTTSNHRAPKRAYRLLINHNHYRTTDVFYDLQTHSAFFTPLPCTYTSSPLDGMARNYHFYLCGYARARNFVMSGSIFIQPPYTREKKHLDNAGIKSSSPAPQTSTLSITPSPLRLFSFSWFFFGQMFIRPIVYWAKCHRSLIRVDIINNVGNVECCVCSAAAAAAAGDCRWRTTQIDRQENDRKELFP